MYKSPIIMPGDKFTSSCCSTEAPYKYSKRETVPNLNEGRSNIDFDLQTGASTAEIWFSQGWNYLSLRRLLFSSNLIKIWPS